MGYVVIAGFFNLNPETDMTTPAKTDQAVWRYGIISRLLHRNEEDATLENELTRLTARPFHRKPFENGCTATDTAAFRHWKIRREKTLAVITPFRKSSKTDFSSYAESIRDGLWPVFSVN